MTAVCRVKRRGLDVAETAFAVSDAKRANLWGKAGPWSQYPARMLRFRARSFALRDQFGDALRGLLTTEEASDVVTVEGTATTVSEGLKFRKATPAEPAVTQRHRDTETQSAEPMVVAVDPAPAPSPADQLADIVTAAGHTFDEFQAWAISQEFYAGEVGRFAEVPDALVARCLKHQKGMLSAIAKHKGEA